MKSDVKGIWSWILLHVGVVVSMGACFPDPPPCVGRACSDEADDESSEALSDVEADATTDSTLDVAEVDLDTVESDNIDLGQDLDGAPELSEAVEPEPDVETSLEIEVVEISETEVEPDTKLVECADLECESEHRECIEVSGSTAAHCGECLPLFRPVDDVCTPLATCDGLACELANRECIDEGAEDDARCGTCLTGYRLDAGTCVRVLDCNDIDCDAVHRECIAGSAIVDADCGVCVPGYSLVVDTCVADAPAPTGVTATTDLELEVEITWLPVDGATGYQVYRCELQTCGGGPAGWFVLNDEPTEDLIFVDDLIEVPPAPAAPSSFQATNASSTVSMSWVSVIAEAARTYRYRVVAIGPGGDSPASSQATGRVAERPVTGYELAIDGGTWSPLGNVTSYIDSQAPAPVVVAPTATASQGTYEGYVQLSATGASVSSGAVRAYQVRAVSAVEPGTAASTTGQRVAGQLMLQWERSTGTAQSGFSPISGATTAAVQDVDAPADGATRWYRVVASSSGAQSATSDVVAGSRLNPASIVPTGVSASSNRAADIEVRWNSVATATGYFVYRCELLDCSGSGGWTQLNVGPHGSTTFLDSSVQVPADPSPPTNVTASTDNGNLVVVRWTPVTVSPAKVYTYRVVAQTANGPSAPSSHVTGKVSDRPVIGYDVVTSSGTRFVSGESAQELMDYSAPEPSISAPTISASAGTFATHVELKLLSGGVASDGANANYQVKAKSSSASSAAVSATGRRMVGPVTYRWERSSGNFVGNFDPIPNATAVSFEDAGAPSDGTPRYYQLSVFASGTAAVTSSAVSGYRISAPTQAPTVQASTDQTDRVRVTWTTVAKATQYRVLRGSTVVATTDQLFYEDLSAPLPPAWGAPTNLGTVATTENVTLTWDAPTRPMGTSTTYTVVPLNAAGDGPSANATGNTTVLALSSYDVQIDGNWSSTGSATPGYTHVAPAGTVTGVAGISQGDFRGHVALTLTSAVATQGAEVTYRVRAKASAATGTETSPVKGRRLVGSISQAWHRSSGSTNGSFSQISAAASFSDTNAPSDGSHRWYKLTLSAPGATSSETIAAEGWRVAFVTVAVGYYASCALTAATDGGRVWCWGSNLGGVMGNGTSSDTAHAPSRVPGLTDVVELGGIGHSHTCVRTSTGQVLCWGNNGTGQLGLGDLNNRTAPVAINGLVATDVSVGRNASCAVTSLKRVQCWGKNESGQLGNNTTTDSSSPVIVLKAPAEALPNASSVSIGDGHACATTGDGLAWCWGENQYGGLGTSPPDDRWTAAQVPDLSSAVEVDVHYRASCARLQDGTVRCWGYNGLGQLGVGNTTSTHVPQSPSGLTSVLGLAVSGGVACARGASAISCWGADDFGRLGNGAGGSSNVPVTVSSPVTAASSIDVSLYHGCSVQTDEVYCWGRNDLGQLGVAGMTESQTPVKVVVP